MHVLFIKNRGTSPNRRGKVKDVRASYSILLVYLLTMSIGVGMGGCDSDSELINNSQTSQGGQIPIDDQFVMEGGASSRGGAIQDQDLPMPDLGGGMRGGRTGWEGGVLPVYVSTHLLTRITEK